MSQNGLITATLANGTDKRHAIPDVALKDMLVRGRTYTRPVCGARGRDSTGYTTVIVSMLDGQAVPFDLSEENACPRCLRIARKMDGGATLAQARHVRAPQITPSVQKQIEEARTDIMRVQAVLDRTTTDNLTGASERRVRLHVQDSPWRIREERVLEYQEPVFLPSLLEIVTFSQAHTSDGRVLTDVAAHRRYYHPKSLRPVVGEKLPHVDLVDESDEDVVAALRLYGIDI